MKFALLPAAVAIAAAALISGACAQLSPCLEGCITTAETQAGCSGLDVACMCTSSKFQADMLACLDKKCTAADLAAAKQFQAEFCGSS